MKMLVISGFLFNTRPLANASVRPVGRVQIVDHLPGLASGDPFTIPSAILEMQPRTRKNEAGVDSR